MELWKEFIEVKYSSYHTVSGGIGHPHSNSGDINHDLGHGGTCWVFVL